jgi:hypothetical protein
MKPGLICTLRYVSCFCVSDTPPPPSIDQIFFSLLTLPWLKQVREAESLASLSAASGRSRHGFEEHLPGSFHDM